MAHHTQQECEALGRVWNKAAACCVGFEPCTINLTTPPPAAPKREEYKEPPPPATTTTPAAGVDVAGITASFRGLIDQFLGFFKGPLDGPKFFIILGMFLFIMTLFFGAGKIAGIPSGMVTIIGFLLIMYGGMQKFSVGGPATSG